MLERYRASDENLTELPPEKVGDDSNSSGEETGS
jgi:hypothetical protein